MEKKHDVNEDARELSDTDFRKAMKMLVTNALTSRDPLARKHAL
jgi:hypothetical protein